MSWNEFVFVLSEDGGWLWKMLKGCFVCVIVMMGMLVFVYCILFGVYGVKSFEIGIFGMVGFKLIYDILIGGVGFILRLEYLDYLDKMWELGEWGK